jgi:sugar lactone lactonase YvrE
MSKETAIRRIVPAAAIPGGEIAVEFDIQHDAAGPRVLLDGTLAHVIAASNHRVLALVPSDIEGEAQVTLSFDDGESQVIASSRLQVGTKLAGDLHPVTNPAFDPGDRTLYVTRSGSRGEHVPITIYRINSEDELEEFSGDITNPTGIAFDHRGQMFVTSRLDGTVYRVSPVKECAVFASDLGIATGLAFNQDGDMFVGDRSGTIFKINGIGEASPWAEHEPSVSAYHLAFGPDDALYVAGPTVSSFDAITRFDKFGAPEVFYRGLGRPQGLAFDTKGNLYVAASLQGRRGVVKISPDGESAELVVAGMNIVGLAFSRQREMIVATNDSIYSLSLGIDGLLMSQDWALTRETS